MKIVASISGSRPIVSSAAPTITESGKIIVYTNDEALFWTKPS